MVNAQCAQPAASSEHQRRRYGTERDLHLPAEQIGEEAVSSAAGVSDQRLLPSALSLMLACYWGAHVKSVSVMRCMECGGEMMLTAVASDDATMPAGFRHETLQCLECRDIERRLVFSRGPIKMPELPRASACPQQPVVSPSSPETITSSSPQSSLPAQDVSSLPPEAVACAPAWARAVEKLRSRQADIHVRFDEEKSDWNVRFNQALEKLAPPRRQPPAADHATARRSQHLAWKSARALRAALRASSSACDRPAKSAIEPLGEAIQRFNRFWDSLLTVRYRSDPAAEASPTLAQPLPPSLSLVRVENPEAVSVAGRAILLLRGSGDAGLMRPTH